MKQRIYIYLAAIIATVLITGCENLYYDAYDSDNPNVYVVGLARPGSNASVYGLYWNNGSMTYVTPYAQNNIANSIFAYKGKAYIAGTVNGVGVYSVDGGTPIEISGCLEAKSVFVYEGDIYVAGIDSSFYPDVWKNGISIELNVAPSTKINSVFVYNGLVYAAGTDQNGATSGVYWTTTTDGITQTRLTGFTTTTVNSIFIYQGNIYIAGKTYDGFNNVACYWNLSVGNDPIFLSAVDESYASSIFVSEGDVYVAGYVSSKAVYWKNGQINYLSDNESYAESIFVYNNDVYVAGRVEPDGDHEVATYWKNGEAFTLYNGTYNTQALSIFVSGE